MKKSTVNSPQTTANKLITNNEELITEYIIPVEGSLGLLALGAKGLREWRKIRKLFKDLEI
jgi:hypothetical protein